MDTALHIHKLVVAADRKTEANGMKFASRKFIVALLLISATTALGAYGRIDSGGITIVLGIVGGGYGLANVADKKNGGMG